MGYLDPKRWSVAVLVLAFAGAAATALEQSEGATALRAFQEWRQLPANAALAFGDALKTYRERLRSLGATDSAADRTIRLIAAHDEGEGYNRIYAGAPEFNTKPNALLVAAVEGVSPGSALDVGMGQGRNALYLASRGWHVTGFDVAEVGLEKAPSVEYQRYVKENYRTWLAIALRELLSARRSTGRPGNPSSRSSRIRSSTRSHEPGGCSAPPLPRPLTASTHLTPNLHG